MTKSLRRHRATRPLVIRDVSDVEVIGCGGTGSIYAEHVARLIRGHGLRVRLRLWDGDKVKRENITRQNFQPHEVGMNKAEALGLRLAGQFGLEVGARASHITTENLRDNRHGTLTVTCTDTLVSRRRVAEARPTLWLDVGNELHHGQAVIGTTHEPDRLGRAYRDFYRGAEVKALPDMAAISPAVLKARRVRTRAGCADQPFLLQGFGVNAMAALAAATITRQILVDHLVTTAGIYFNVSDGRMGSRPITRDILRPWAGVKAKGGGSGRGHGCPVAGM